MLVLFQCGVRLRGEALRGWTCCWDWVECGIDISFPERLATQQAGEPYLRGCACWSVKQYTQTPAQRMRETAGCCSKLPLMADLGSNAAMAPAGTAGVGRSFTRPLVMDEAGRGYVCSHPENVCTSSTGAAACLASASPCSRQSVPPLDGRIPEALITLIYSPSYLSHQWRRNPSPQQRPPTRHSSGAASAPNRWEGEPGLGGPAVVNNPSISALKRLLQPTIQETRLPAATAPGDGTGGGSAARWHNPFYCKRPLLLAPMIPPGRWLLSACHTLLAHPARPTHARLRRASTSLTSPTSMWPPYSTAPPRSAARSWAWASPPSRSASQCCFAGCCCCCEQCAAQGASLPKPKRPTGVLRGEPEVGRVVTVT